MASIDSFVSSSVNYSFREEVAYYRAHPEGVDRLAPVFDALNDLAETRKYHLDLLQYDDDREYVAGALFVAGSLVGSAFAPSFGIDYPIVAGGLTGLVSVFLNEGTRPVRHFFYRLTNNLDCLPFDDKVHHLSIDPNFARAVRSSSSHHARTQVLSGVASYLPDSVVADDARELFGNRFLMNATGRTFQFGLAGLASSLLMRGDPVVGGLFGMNVGAFIGMFQTVVEGVSSSYWSHRNVGLWQRDIRDALGEGSLVFPDAFDRKMLLGGLVDRWYD